MTSLKHVVQRRVHLERSQPQRRRKYGILEKHKDYILRARDYDQKRRTLRSLREKARNRNPNEFYFNMINSRINKDGRYEIIPKEVLPKDKLRENHLNRGLVALRQSVDAKVVEKAKEVLHFVESESSACNPPGTHLTFVDSDGAASDADNSDTSEKSEAAALVQLGLRSLKQRRRKKSVAVHASGEATLFAPPKPPSDKDIELAVGAATDILGSLASSYAAVKEHQLRAQKFEAVLEKLDLQKHLADKKNGAAKRVMLPDGTKGAHRWLTKRKR